MKDSLHSISSPAAGSAAGGASTSHRGAGTAARYPAGSLRMRSARWAAGALALVGLAPLLRRRRRGQA